MKVLVLLNEAAGTLAASQERDEESRIAEGFARAGVEAVVRAVPAAELSDNARRARDDGFDWVIGGGGDGTLNTIAAALAENGTPFGVLPLGTHNHFAKELNIPLDLDAAIAAVAHGRVEEMDIAEVNGKIFLNFSALGFHPLVVKHRDAQRERRKRNKIVALWVAIWHVMWKLPLLRVRLCCGPNAYKRLTPSVIVCNNIHQMEVFGTKDVSHHQRDMLNVYLARSRRWYGMLWLIIRAIFRRVGNAKTFEALVTPEVTIETRSRHARVSIDGEVMDLSTPLHYRVRRGGLNVVMPAASPGSAANADASPALVKAN